MAWAAERWMYVNRRKTDFRARQKMVTTNFTRAILAGADLRGVDLRTAVGLTIEQIQQSVTDENTRLPDYLKKIPEKESELRERIVQA